MFDGIDVDSDFLSAYGKDLDEYADKYEKLGKQANTASIGIDDFNKELAKSGKQTVKSTTLLQDIGNGIKSVGKTALSMVGNGVLDLAIGTGLQLVIGGISDYINREKIAIEQGQEAKQAISDTFNEFSNSKTTLNTLGQSFSKSTDMITNTGDAIDSVAQKYTELAKGVSTSFSKIL